MVAITSAPPAVDARHHQSTTHLSFILYGIGRCLLSKANVTLRTPPPCVRSCSFTLNIEGLAFLTCLCLPSQ
ncbi:unnamed protein product [Lactuca virosa]|uniref:Uncharacterized protein n=1 Tax=Lactuca virosa TaxID=75947 RepID=A0AAU9LHX0_9ASTR|nr:unnamed protein product [Lactuca virosa]